ncbi:hypothetical protein DS745_15415 [Anaerobacillus alkaliphilus]|uniref:Uncharacterized protein n=2 Tax=Anaerobacillus alkaliphilus TaxID=1548597 RepID=A0A4Q0VN44_9BACI|nr:hypothetical protein DS745_15415 [Anaerobacillus alkaliphilus]
MKPKDHQEKQRELEQAFQQNQSNANTIKNNQEKIMSQSDLVEMSGMLFETEVKTSPTIGMGAQPATFQPNQSNQQNMSNQQNQSMQMPIELQQAQQAVHSAQLTLLNETQQLEQALYQLHKAQDKVKQCQFQVQQAQKQVQMAQNTASTYLNNMYH